MTRMCFFAKNKTLRAVFRLSHSTSMLAYGWKGPEEGTSAEAVRAC